MVKVAIAQKVWFTVIVYYNHGVEFLDYKCNINAISDINIITVEIFEYPCISHNISKSEEIDLLETFSLEDCGYM